MNLAARSTVLIALLAVLAATPAQGRTGPSTREAPLLRPLVEGVEIVTILAAGDAVADRDPSDPAAGEWPIYRFPGHPEGLALDDRGDGTFSLIVSHPLYGTQGIRRSHGPSGAFVTRWRLRASDLTVLEGGDLIRRVVVSGDVVPSDRLKAFSYLGSASLAPPRSLYHDDGAGRTVGTLSRLVLGGERFQSGYAWAHVLTGAEAGTTHRLDSLGCCAPTSVYACPVDQERTVVLALDDSSIVPRTSVGSHGPPYPSEIFVYTGEKRRQGNVVERAGLVGGVLRGLRVEDCVAENPIHGLGKDTRIAKARFDLVAVGRGGDATGVYAMKLQNQVIQAGATQFRSPRGGAWDPSRPTDFWFTTDGETKRPHGRLWRLRFDDVTRPERGGTIEIVLEGAKHDLVMPADVAVLPDGTVVFQEAPGKLEHRARIWMLRPGGDAPIAVAAIRPNRTGVEAEGPSSPAQTRGIVDASSILGPGWVLTSVQVPGSTRDDEIVAGGQVLAIRLPPR